MSKKISDESFESDTLPAKVGAKDSPKKDENTQEFGQRLKKFRTGKGWSLEKVATLTGITASTLSRVENNKLSPTLDILNKMVEGLNIHPYEVLRPDTRTKKGLGIHVTKRQERRTVEYPNLIYQPLNDSDDSAAMKSILVTLFATSLEDYGGLAGHDGEEFVYVLHGSVEILFEGDKSYILEEGDSIYFDSHLPHAYLSRNGAQAKLLMVATTIDKPFKNMNDELTF